MQTEARYETPTEDGSVIDAYIRMTEDIRQLALLLHNMADRDDDFDNCTIEAVPKVLTPEEFAEHYPDIHEEEDEQ